MKGITTWLKAKWFLLMVIFVWGWLISTIWEFQLVISLLGFIPNKFLRDARERIWLWQDQGVNVIASMLAFMPAGNPDITVSSKVGFLAELDSKTAMAMEKIINIFWYLIFQEKDHCKKAIERDEEHYV